MSQVDNLRVLVLGELGDHLLPRVRTAEHITWLDEATAAESPIDAVLIFAMGIEEQVRKVLDTHPEVRWVHLRSAGVPPRTLDLMRGRPQPLTNSSGAFGAAMAEVAVGTIIWHVREFPKLLGAKAQRRYKREFEPELRGKTAVILGMGDVGLAIARPLEVLGVRLIGVRRAPQARDEFEQIVHIDELDSVLPRAEILVIAVPGTPDTDRLIDARRLALLPRGSFVVNMSRGSTLDEEALIAALQNRHLGGAHLDVTEREPLQPESPLWDMPNVFLSYHNAWYTEETERRVLEIFLENAERLRTHRPLQHVVDLDKGY